MGQQVRLTVMCAMTVLCRQPMAACLGTARSALAEP